VENGEWKLGDHPWKNFLSTAMRIGLRNLTKRYKSTTALDGVSLEIPAGSIVAVIGLNGAGKSTMLRAMAGVITPSEGTIEYDGTRFSRDDLALRRRMFWMPDMPILRGDFNAIEHIAMMVKAYQVPVDDALESTIIDTLARLDILQHAGVPLQTLSRGQLYKAALTAMHAVAPDLMLLDEPFASGIDPRAQAVVREMAAALTARGGTFVYTTQIPEIVARFADMVCVLDHGRFAALVSRADLDSMAGEGINLLEKLMENKP
jgi:ABC-type multidrug transport system ATPase subunit